MGHLFARTGGDLSSVRYLDIGAADPVLGSNTYALYQQGAHGVLVEPMPYKADLLRRIRLRDTVVRTGAAFDSRRSAELTLFGPGNAGLFDTFKPAQFQRDGGSNCARSARSTCLSSASPISSRNT